MRTFTHLILFLCSYKIHWSIAQDIIGPPQCPPDYVGDQKAKLCYGFQSGAPSNTRTWPEAAQICRENHGNISVIIHENQSVLKYLRKRAAEKGIGSAWVGATDQPGQNGFIWSNGSPVNQKGMLKFKENYPVKHDKPSCIVLEFGTTEEVRITNAPCGKDKRSFVCMMKLFTPGQQKKKYHSGDKQGSQNKVKTASAAEIADLIKGIPMSGTAQIVAVSADKLVRARSHLITRMFGSPILSEDDMDKMMPKGLLAANISDGALASSRALLMELAGDYLGKHRRDNATEVAKVLTSRMLEKGRAIRCSYGVNEKQRLVECISSAGIIKECVKATAIDGTVVRDCGMAGISFPGCHTTIQGVVCFCENDLCNKASGVMGSSKLLALVILSVIIKQFRP